MLMLKISKASLLSLLSALALYTGQPTYAGAPGNAFVCGAALRDVNPGVRVRSFAEIKKLKIMNYNVENLFMSVGKWIRTSTHEFKSAHDESAPEEKPAWAVNKIRKLLHKADADILILEEVESVEALEKLVSEPPLAGLYTGYLIQGNDPRGINIGFLVKNDLPFHVELETHKDMMWYDPVEGQKIRIFSRDIPTLVLRKGPDENPFMIVMGNHSKSKRDRPNDPESNILRGLQYEAIAKIISDYYEQFGKDLPMVLGGDFNDDVRTAPSLSPIRKFLKSAFDLVANPMPLKARVTETYHPKEGEPVYAQLDDQMMSPSLAQSVADVQIIRYEDENGNVMPLPQTYYDRKKQPSDHFPVLVTINTDVLFGNVEKANMPVTKKRPAPKPSRRSPEIHP